MKSHTHVIHFGKRLSLIGILLLCCFVGLWAQQITSGNVKLIGSSAPEAKLEGSYTIKMPFLQGEGALFQSNSIRGRMTVGLSPVSGNFALDVALSPIAVMELHAGALIGTGWDFSPMGLEGLRISESGDVVSDMLGGLYYCAKGGAVLQFDTAAITGDAWKSVVMRVYQELNYQGYTNAQNQVGWEYELSGLKRNGFSYKGDYFIGYQMPIMVNLVGVLLETYRYNLFEESTSELFMDVGLVTNIGLGQNFSVTVIPQMTTKVVDPDTREISLGSIYFNRLVAMVNYSF